MEKALSIATSVVQTLQNAGHTTYFAGGWVRDFLLKHPSDDIDIATSASPEQIATLFPKTIHVGIAFGILVVVQEGHSFEVATFRKEKEYVDGRRPSHIEPTSAQEDALRRDFTINGMFYDPISKTLYDFVDGQEDLANKCIRAIGNPTARFFEDRLRMMRAVRYSTRFGFKIEKKTKKAIVEHAKDLFPSVAIERVMQEFKKMSQFAHFDKGLLLLMELHLLPVIFPALKSLPKHEIEHRLLPISDYPKDTPTIIPILALFSKASLEERLSLCEYLKLSSQEKDFVIRFHKFEQMVLMPSVWREGLEPIEWAHVYADPQACLLLNILKAHEPPEKQESFIKEHQNRMHHLQATIDRLQNKKPVVTAEHLLKEGIKPGKSLGLLLKEAEKISARERIFDPVPIIEKLKKLPFWD